MNKIYKIFIFSLLISGCGLLNPNGGTFTNRPFVELGYYIWWKSDNMEDESLKQNYINRIKEYLKSHPGTSEEVSENMFKGFIYFGMTEEQVLAMAKPIKVIENKKFNKKIFKYSEKNKIKGVTRRFFFGDSLGGSSITALIYLENGTVINLTTVVGM